MNNNLIKIITIPGNGNSSQHDQWFPYISKELGALGIQIIAEEFPDRELARKEQWLPFIKKLGADNHTILIGHSSGAVAAMRYAEEHKILGLVLVGVYYIDLGYDSEKQSGYFDTPWDWQKIKDNQEWSIIFASRDDPHIPIEVPRFVRDQLNSEYHEYIDEGHFGTDKNRKKFPEMIEIIKRKIL